MDHTHSGGLSHDHEGGETDHVHAVVRIARGVETVAWRLEADDTDVVSSPENYTGPLVRT